MSYTRRTIVAVGVAGLAGCTASLPGMGEEQTTEDAAAELEERVGGDEYVNRVQAEPVDGGPDIDVEIWYSVPEDEDERINLLDVYADLVDSGYDIGDMVLLAHAGQYEFDLIVQRDWAEQYNDGELTREEFAAKLDDQV